MTEKEAAAIAHEHFEERAGILEFEAGMSRHEAQRRAQYEARRVHQVLMTKERKVSHGR